MNMITIGSFPEFISYVEGHYSKNHLFRGLKNTNYPLIPKIGRDAYVKMCSPDPAKMLYDLQDLEERTVSAFVKMAVPYADLRTISAWEQWTIGQHHGLPTRFLDWTENPLIAAYFATENAGAHDVAIYVVDKSQFNTETIDSLDVFSFADGDNVVLHIPSYINPRIIAQKGVFTVHKNPTLPLDQTMINGELCQIDQLIIPQHAVREFIKDLDWFGINRSFIYPGLDGLAYYLDFKAKGGVD